MRSLWGVLAVAAVIALGWSVWWYEWGSLKAGPPEAVVQAFLQAVQTRDWGTAEAYMTQHMRGRIGQEGFGAMQQFVEARLEPFSAFEVVRVAPRGEEADVIVRLLLPINEGQSPQPVASTPGIHGGPGRVEGRNFVHSHRFQLQQEGRGAWRIYQFEEVDERS
jgi:hypothetical protein